MNVDGSGNELLLNEEGRNTGPLLGASRNNPMVSGSTYHAISESGDKVFFSATPSRQRSVDPLRARTLRRPVGLV